MVNSSEKLTLWSRAVGRVSALPAVQQAGYQMVKCTLLAVYKYLPKHIIRKCLSRVVIQTKLISVCGIPEKFSSMVRFYEVPIREVVMMEEVLAKLPPWLEAQMRNLNCQNYLS